MTLRRENRLVLKKAVNKVVRVRFREVWEYDIVDELEDGESPEEFIEHVKDWGMDHHSVGGLTGADHESTTLVHYSVFLNGEQIQ
jgi:hypothetical protein